MLKRMYIENFTVFAKADLEFGQLNVIHGENGTGKTHLLKLVHHMHRVGKASKYDPNIGSGRSGVIQRIVFGGPTLAWLFEAFPFATPGELVHWDEYEAVVSVWTTTNEGLEVRISPEGVASNPADVERSNTPWTVESAYIPAQDTLARDRGWNALVDRFQMREETLGALLRQQLLYPMPKTPNPAQLAVRGGLLAILPGPPKVTDEGDVYFQLHENRRVFAYMAALGHLKVAALVLLIEVFSDANWSLIWDEPEANLNPRLIKVVAKALVDLAAAGVQVFVATHSLFLLRQLYLLNKLRQTPVDARYIGLHRGADGVEVKSGPDVADSGDVVALDEQLAQADLYMDVEMGVKTAATEARP